jgi:integrase
MPFDIAVALTIEMPDARGPLALSFDGVACAAQPLDVVDGVRRDRDNFRAAWHKVRDQLRVPDVTSHSFCKSLATLIDDEGLSARIGADHLGHARVSETQATWMARGRVHTEVADLLERRISDE